MVAVLVLDTKLARFGRSVNIVKDQNDLAFHPGLVLPSWADTSQ